MEQGDFSEYFGTQSTTVYDADIALLSSSDSSYRTTSR